MNDWERTEGSLDPPGCAWIEEDKAWNFVLQPLRQFRWRYVTLSGYKDGWRGLVLSVLVAHYEFVRYYRLWRLQRG